jgi:hypothetical protein
MASWKEYIFRSITNHLKEKKARPFKLAQTAPEQPGAVFLFLVDFNSEVLNVFIYKLKKHLLSS